MSPVGNRLRFKPYALESKCAKCGATMFLERRGDVCYRREWKGDPPKLLTEIWCRACVLAKRR